MAAPGSDLGIRVPRSGAGYLPAIFNRGRGHDVVVSVRIAPISTKNSRAETQTIHTQ